jgi:hypothetical protein
MGFLSQQITAPNFQHYAAPYYSGVNTQYYQQQIQAMMAYADDLWGQWENYRTMGQEAIAGLSKSMDSRYNAIKSQIDTSYENQVKDLDETAEDAKKRLHADARRRGVAFTTTKQFDRDLKKQHGERRGDLTESRDQMLMNLEAQQKEWSDELARSKYQIEQWTESQRPIMMNPGPEMTQNFLMNEAAIGEAAQDPNIVVGEEGGWGGLMLTGLGAGVGALFGPAGMMMGAGLGGALGGGLEAGFGAPGYQQRGGQQMLGGLMSAGMAGFSPHAQWGWGNSAPALSPTWADPNTLAGPYAGGGGWQSGYGVPFGGWNRMGQDYFSQYAGAFY